MKPMEQPYSSTNGLPERQAISLKERDQSGANPEERPAQPYSRHQRAAGRPVQAGRSVQTNPTTAPDSSPSPPHRLQGPRREEARGRRWRARHRCSSSTTSHQGRVGPRTCQWSSRRRTPRRKESWKNKENCMENYKITLRLYQILILYCGFLRYLPMVRGVLAAAFARLTASVGSMAMALRFFSARPRVASCSFR